ncbi:hypothetical protein XELAEV_18032957mg [Xenopus laevis]|uniref:Uncharacterized protein n=1 Tax=Xenopus laevis TaxID=8355 RepID=A0A974CJX2_XENLA|nr:hypothetical protein XELAEV_18032957mg [Xenopus laevis]
MEAIYTPEKNMASTPDEVYEIRNALGFYLLNKYLFSIYLLAKSISIPPKTLRILLTSYLSSCDKPPLNQHAERLHAANKDVKNIQKGTIATPTAPVLSLSLELPVRTHHLPELNELLRTEDHRGDHKLHHRKPDTCCEKAFRATSKNL